MWCHADKRIALLGWTQACFDLSIAVFWLLWTPTLVVSFIFTKWFFPQIEHSSHAQSSSECPDTCNQLVGLTGSELILHVCFMHAVQFCSDVGSTVFCAYTWSKVRQLMSSFLCLCDVSGRRAGGAHWSCLCLFDGFCDAWQFNCSVSSLWPVVCRTWDIPPSCPLCGGCLFDLASVWLSGTVLHFDVNANACHTGSWLECASIKTASPGLVSTIWECSAYRFVFLCHESWTILIQSSVIWIR